MLAIHHWRELPKSLTSDGTQDGTINFREWKEQELEEGVVAGVIVEQVLKKKINRNLQRRKGTAAYSSKIAQHEKAWKQEVEPGNIFHVMILETLILASSGCQPGHRVKQLVLENYISKKSVQALCFKLAQSIELLGQRVMNFVQITKNEAAYLMKSFAGKQF